MIKKRVAGRESYDAHLITPPSVRAAGALPALCAAAAARPAQPRAPSPPSFPLPPSPCGAKGGCEGARGGVRGGRRLHSSLPNREHRRKGGPPWEWIPNATQSFAYGEANASRACSASPGSTLIIQSPLLPYPAPRRRSACSIHRPQRPGHGKVSPLTFFFSGRPRRVGVACAWPRREGGGSPTRQLRGAPRRLGGKQPLNYNHTFHSHFMLCGFLPH